MTAGPAANAILAAWTTTLAARGGAPAVLDARGGTLRTFADIEAESGECAHLLEAIAQRAVVAVRIGNHPAWPALLLALFRRSLVPLPLGRHIEKAELDAALATCGAAALVEAGPDGLRVLPRPRSHAVDADFLKLTSGTTAAPRAIRFRARHLLADCDHICATMGLRADDVNFGAIPFSHSYGFSNLITPLLARGIALVATEDRMPRAILDGLARSGATVFPGMPVFFEKLADIANSPALPRLRLCISAGALLQAATAARFAARFGLKIHAFYGSSECGGIAYDAGAEPCVEEGFVGAAMCGADIAPLADGRIAVRGAAVGEGYHPEPDEAVLGGGRFIPGDLVECSPRGLRIVGRASDVINVAGRKLNPAEIEQRLLQCPGVRAAVVFGVPSRLRGEEPVACVAGAGIDAGAVIEFCRAHLSLWQVPRDVWIVPEIAVSERGKISRRVLAANYLAAHARR